MKRVLSFFLLFALLLSLTACAEEPPAQATLPPATIPPTTEAAPPEPEPPAVTLPKPVPRPPVLLQPVLALTEEEQAMLLKLGMAERGNCGCTECIALVMCSVLNRVEAGRFGGSIYGVIHAQDQYTPVSDGSYFTAEPNENCYDALEMVLYGWDESQGALYYEWCEGESWHSKNLNLLFQHCDVRFYD